MTSAHVDHIVLMLTRDVQLPLEGVQGGYLVYREASEAFFALDPSRAVTGRRPLAADAASAVLAQLYHTGAVVPYSLGDRSRLESTVGAKRPTRPAKRSSGGLALMR